jgi:hypothetical protein
MSKFLGIGKMCKKCDGDGWIYSGVKRIEKECLKCEGAGTEIVNEKTIKKQIQNMSLLKMKTNLTQLKNLHLSYKDKPVTNRFKLRDGSATGIKYNAARRNVDPFVDEILKKTCIKQERVSFTESYSTYSSNVRGITSGRFIIYVQKLGRVLNGNTHRVVIAYTPYGFQIRDVKMFSTPEQLKGILKAVNAKLVA